MTAGAKSLSSIGRLGDLQRTGLGSADRRPGTGGEAPISLGEIHDISRRWDRTADERTLTMAAKEDSQRTREEASRYLEAHYERQRRVETRRLRSPKPHLPAGRSGAGWY